MRFACLSLAIAALAACAGSPGPTAMERPADGTGGVGGTGGTSGAGGIGGAGGTAATVPPASREVTFASAAADAFAHVGTLQIPAHSEGEKLPAVIFAHGSGPNDRDVVVGSQLGMSFGVDIPIFVELGQALQDAGFVVLRFDKRTCGPFNGCADNGYPVSNVEAVDVFIEDVEGGLAFLAAQPEVDPDRLFFVGHSKGALYAPRLLDGHPELRAGVMLAGPFRPVDHSMRAQAEKLEEILTATGASPSQIDAALSEVRAWATALEELRADTFVGTHIGGLPLAYWESWMRLGDEAPVIAAGLDRPLLVLSGDYDWNVPPSETESWAAHLGDDTIHETLIVPCVTHALNCISNPDWMRIRPGDIGAHVDEAVIDSVVTFLGANDAQRSTSSR